MNHFSFLMSLTILIIKIIRTNYLYIHNLFKKIYIYTYFYKIEIRHCLENIVSFEESRDEMTHIYIVIDCSTHIYVTS